MRKTFIWTIILFLNFHANAHKAIAQSRIGSSVRYLAAQTLTKRAKITGKADRLDVSIRFREELSRDELSRWENQGIEFIRIDNHLMHLGRIYAATITTDMIETLENNHDIERVESSWRPRTAGTLNVSNPQVQASLVWESSDKDTLITGKGILVADIDTGIDIYHPGFFRADGDTLDWIDVNENGIFDSGTDAVDINMNGSLQIWEILRFWEPSIQDALHLQPRTADFYDVDLDWLYNDANNDGRRNYGAEEGYTEVNPTFGEALYIVLDDNDNNTLNVDEKLIALGTSKVKAILEKDGAFFRGNNLLDTKGDVINHGTGACGVLGGQVPGRRLVGIAPGVEILAINREGLGPEVYIPWAKMQSADIMMYEFGSWVFEFLDGSSHLEQLINKAALDGIVQFTAAGNLAGPRRKKHAYIEIPPSEGVTLPIAIQEGLSITTVYMSVLWRHPTTYLTFRMIAPDGRDVSLFGRGSVSKIDNVEFYSYREVSDSSTAKMDIAFNNDEGLEGTYILIIDNPKAHTEPVDAYLADDKTVWIGGAQFQDHVTDDGTVTSPGTAINSITIGAYDPRGTRNENGEINDFSGWGLTVDGRMAVDLTAPGTLVYSLISSKAYGATLGGYMEYSGTSSALPHAVGAAALLLEIEPGLFPEEVRSILIEGALSDEFTGTIPNVTWGYGKLRIYDALLTAGLIHDHPSSIGNISIHPDYILHEPWPNPFNGTLQVKVTVRKPGDAYTLDIYNIRGQKINCIYSGYLPEGEHIFLWNSRDDLNREAATGLYFVVLTGGQTNLYRKAILLR